MRGKGRRGPHLLQNSCKDLKSVNRVHVTGVRQRSHKELCKFVTFVLLQALVYCQGFDCHSSAAQKVGVCTCVHVKPV